MYYDRNMEQRQPDPFTPAVVRWNKLVEEFDEATGFRFDKQTDPQALALIASQWPTCRLGLAKELWECAGRVYPADPFVELNRRVGA